MVEENDSDTVARAKTRGVDLENANQMVAVLVEEAVVVADSVVLVVVAAVVVVDHLVVEVVQVDLLVVLVMVDHHLLATIMELKVVLLQAAATGATNPHLLPHNKTADYLTVEPTTAAPITAQDHSHHSHNRTGTRGTTNKCRTGSSNNHRKAGDLLLRSNSNTKHSPPSTLPSLQI